MRFTSLLGMFDGLIDKISNFFTDFGNSIFNSGLMKIIGTVLYGLSYALFLVIDFLSMFFRRIVGLETGVTLDLETGGSQAIEGDIVLTLIQSKEVMNVFFSLLIVAIFLLFVSTIVAIIKSEYNFDKGGNAKGPIFGRAIKAVFYFLSVPTICIFGVFMANQLLLLLDQATRQSTSTKISSLVFASCCEKSNRVLNDTTFWNGYRTSEAVSGAKSGGGAFFYRNATTDGNDIQNTTANREGVAYGINAAFANETAMEFVTNGSVSFSDGFEWSTNGDMGRPTEVDSSRSAFKAHYGLTIKNVSDKSTFSVYNVDLVWFYFDLMSYDHLISLLASFLILKSLFDLSMGVVKRIYEMIVLFCVSPPIVALMPLDEGTAYKNWTKAFVSKTLAAYGGVLAMNFFFMLVPVLRRINVFGANGVMFGSINLSSVFNYLAQLMMIIAGAVSLTSISGMISGLIGADDAVSEGASVSKATMGGIAGAIGFGMGAGRLIGKGIKATAAIPKHALNAGQQLGRDMKNIATGNSGNSIENTTADIASELGTGNSSGASQAPDSAQAVGNNAGGGDSTPPGGPSGGTPPSGGGSSGGGQSNGMVSGSSGGASSSGEKFGDKVYDRAGKLAHVSGNYLREGATAKGVGRAFMQTGRATGAVGAATGRAVGGLGRSTGASFAAMAHSKSLGGKVGHFFAGVGKAVATGATAAGMAVATAATAVGTATRTVARGAGMTLRMGGAVLKNFALPALKGAAKGVGAVGGLVASAATGGESSKVSAAVKGGLTPPDKRDAARKSRAARNEKYDNETQSALRKKYQQEYDVLQQKYAGKNSDMSGFYRDLESLQKKYKNKGLKDIR